MRVLVISRSPWRNDNSFGNTYNNIFGKMKDVMIANIYLADGIPDTNNPNVVSYYQISEKQIIHTILNRTTHAVGSVIDVHMVDNTIIEGQGTYDKAITRMKKKRWSGFFLARELVWRIGKIDFDGLLSFSRAFNPDIIFLPFYYAVYVDRVALFVQQKLNIPMVLEASIDIYSLKQLSFDPVFWINRFIIRRYVRKTVAASEKLFVISDEMKRDYERYLKIKCGVLYKFPVRERKLSDYVPKKDKIEFLFTGNIGSGRWKTLSYLGDTLSEAKIGELIIYTPTPLSRRMKRRLKSCVVKPPVPAGEVIELQNNADILVHTESFDLKDKLEVRYSISTKVMDYISTERCILAIGPEDIASISFLKSHDLAIVATSEELIKTTVNEIKMNPQMICRYVKNTNTYMNNLTVDVPQQDELRADLERIIDSFRRKNHD